MRATALVSYVIVLRLPGASTEIPIEIPAENVDDLDHAVTHAILEIQTRYSEDVAKDAELVRAYTVTAVKELVHGHPTANDIAEQEAAEEEGQEPEKTEPAKSPETNENSKQTVQGDQSGKASSDSPGSEPEAGKDSQSQKKRDGKKK